MDAEKISWRFTIASWLLLAFVVCELLIAAAFDFFDVGFKVAAVGLCASILCFIIDIYFRLKGESNGKEESQKEGS